MNTYTTLIAADELKALPADGVLLCDCRFNLADPAEGARLFAEAHIPGAVHLDLDRVLSGPKTGTNGRHPLPERAALAAALAQAGAKPDRQIVAYDAADGMFAARLWWLVRWLGHARVAVLDGGFSSWRTAGGELEAGAARTRAPGDFTAQDSLVPVLDHDAVRAGGALVLDARAPDRFRGENETLDKIGGHIPSAKNRFFRDNLALNHKFKPADVLRAEYEALFAGRPAAEVVSQCGSGVTACHNLLALEVAGLPGAALYPGSWSEWSSRPGAPVATGDA